MSNQEKMPLNPLRPGTTPEWLSEMRLPAEAQTQFIASKIALVLADPEKASLLEKKYEGSSFTPTVGEEVGFVSGEHDLDPVRDGLKELKRKGVLEYQSHWIEGTENESGGDGASEASEPSRLGRYVIEVIFHADKAEEFLT